MNEYQVCRYFIGSIVLVLDRLLLNKDTGDTQAGLKGFRTKKFKQIKFYPKIFDAELMILFLDQITNEINTSKYETMLTYY